MKYLASLLILCVLLITGCKKETEVKPVSDKNKFAFDSTDIKTTAAQNPNEAFQLIYKLEKGKKYNYRLSTISKDLQTIQDDSSVSQNGSQNIIYLFTLTGQNIDNDGTAELECNVNSVRLDAQVGSQSFSYESGKADSASKARFSDYEALINNPFSLRVSKYGEIVEIFRIDKILNKFLKLKGYADSVNAEQKNLLRRDLSDGAIKQLMMQVFREVPQKMIAKDSSWQKVQPDNRLLVFTMKSINTFKVAGLEMMGTDKIAIIDAGLNTSFTGNTTALDRGITYNFQKPVTTAAGKIFFNITKGLIQKSRTQTMMSMSFSAQGQTPQGLRKRTQKQSSQNTNILELL